MLLMIDSGAARSVCPEAYAKHVPLAKYNDGISLVGANGGVIETYGKRRVGYRLKDGRGFSVDYTVAKVRRPVVSVSQAVDRGMSWVFSPAGSFMVRGAVTFEAQHKVEMIRMGDLYFVDADSFAGLGEKEIMPVQVAVPVEAALEGVPEERSLWTQRSFKPRVPQSRSCRSQSRCRGTVRFRCSLRRPSSRRMP
jgi:hypothetical protein